MKRIVAIVANGELLNQQLSDVFFDSVDLIIAADGGAAMCKACNIEPHYIIGDLDSVDKETLQHFSSAEIIRITEQDSTDMEKALQFARKFNPGKLRVLSAIGRRSDHSTANLMFLKDFNETIPVEIFDNYGILRILEPGRHVIEHAARKTVSFFSIQPVSNLTLHGFRYPLSKKSYHPYFVGISNVIEQNNCFVEFDSGTLFFYELLSEG